MSAADRHTRSRTRLLVRPHRRGPAASVDSDSPRPRCSATAQDFRLQGAARCDAGWTGEGFELVNDGRIVEPEQQELALEADRQARGLGAHTGAGRARSTDAARALAAAARRGGGRPRAFSPLAADDGKRWQRGLLLHELLRHLPALPRRRSAPQPRTASSPSRRMASTRAEIADWADEALAVTEAPAHAALFAEGSRAEVPLIGTVKTPRGTFTVSGQVDRLAVTDREVLIVDYKTNRPPPDVGGRRGAGLSPPARALPGAAAARSIPGTACGLSCCGRQHRD